MANELSYAAVMRFSRTLAHISTKARDELRKAVANVDFDDVDKAIERVREIMQAIAAKYGLGARELAAQWYDYCRQLEIGRGYTAGIGEGSRYSMNSDIDVLAAKVKTGELSTDDFLARMGGVMVNQMHREARNTILANLSDDYQQAEQRGDAKTASKMGFCRVPVAGGCAFCVLLASRSYYPWQQYVSAQTAGDAKKYHDDCRCVVVPFTKAISIPGYGEKLEQYNNAYRDADNTRRSGMMPDGEPMPDELKLRIAQAKMEHAEKFACGEVEQSWRPINEDLIIMRWNNPTLH